jgi:hypothetical protein
MNLDCTGRDGDAGAFGTGRYSTLTRSTATLAYGPTFVANAAAFPALQF